MRFGRKSIKTQSKNELQKILLDEHMKQNNNELDAYSASKIMRRCGLLGIPYEKVISSRYGKSQGWRLGKCKIQYRDGKDGTIGFGEKKQQLPEKDSTPHTLERMKSLLGIS